MRYVKCSTMALWVLFIASCTSAEPPPSKTVFDPLTQQIDKAREVQKTVDENAEKTRKAIDAEEHGAPTP
jgi:hypothetical protein